MTDKLKPCPAGHEATVRHSALFESYFVGCEPECWDGPHRKTEADAIAAWNHRPTEDALKASTEAAEKRAADAENLLLVRTQSPEQAIITAVANEYASFEVVKCRLKFRTRALRIMKGRLKLANRELSEAIHEVQMHHCPHCSAALELQGAMLDKSQKRLVETRKERDDAQRQAAAMRAALEEIQHTCKIPREDLVLHQVDKSTCAVVAECALQHDAGRYYVPRAELEAAQKRVGELREVLKNYSWSTSEYGAFCNACGYECPDHKPGCDIGKALGKEAE